MARERPNRERETTIKRQFREVARRDETTVVLERTSPSYYARRTDEKSWSRDGLWCGMVK